MPRSKEGKKREKINKHDIENAVNAIITNSMSFREAAEVFKVKVATLHRLVKAYKSSELDKFEYKPNNAVKKVFTEVMELELISYVKQAARMHYGLSKKEMRKLAFQYAKANNLNYPQQWDEAQLAGAEWMRGFMKKFSAQISLRKPESTSLARSTSFNRHNVQTFFDNLKKVHEKYGPFPPHRIFNVDETGLSTVHIPPKILAPKGIKQLGSATSGERGQNVTLIAAISAVGNHLPPMFVFPRVHFKDYMIKGAPVGSKGSANQSGWSNETLFLEWLDFFIEHVKPSVEEPVLMVLDNHESHCSLAVIEKARTYGVKMLTFPPHTSHRLQPLDCTVFGSFKLNYNKAVSDWMSVNPGKPVSIYEVAEMVGRAFPLAFTSKNILSGFAATGISPLNVDIFTDDDFLSAYSTDRPEPNLHQTADQNPEPSTSTCHNNSVLSPEFIRPFPKAAPRKPTTRGRKKGKSTILTETPEKTSIEDASLTPPKTGKIEKIKKDKVKRNLTLEESDEEGNDYMSLRGSSDDEYDIHEEIKERENEEEFISLVTGQKLTKDILALPDVIREVDQHVAFIYQGGVFPGKILDFNNESVTITSMQKSLKSWKWPEKPDVLSYPWEDVLGSLKPPMQVSKRGFFRIPEFYKLE